MIANQIVVLSREKQLEFLSPSFNICFTDRREPLKILAPDRKTIPYHEFIDKPTRTCDWSPIHKSSFFDRPRVHDHDRVGLDLKEQCSAVRPRMITLFSQFPRGREINEMDRRRCSQLRRDFTRTVIDKSAVFASHLSLVQEGSGKEMEEECQ
jgi:hypothetical protein